MNPEQDKEPLISFFLTLLIGLPLASYFDIILFVNNNFLPYQAKDYIA